MFCKKGFTLVELVMIIVVLAILAAVAIPKYYDLQADARSAAEMGVVGGVRAGVHTYFAENRSWPTSLDEAGTVDGAASTTNPLFGNVLSQGGITSDWTKAGNVYTGPAGGVYTYDNTDGSFE